MIVCIGTEKGQTSNCDPKYLPTENCMTISSRTLLYQNAVRCIYKMQLLSFDLYCVKTQEEEDVSSDNHIQVWLGDHIETDCLKVMVRNLPNYSQV